MKQSHFIRHRHVSIHSARTDRPLLFRRERHAVRFLVPVLSCIALMALPLCWVDPAEPMLFSPLDDVLGLGLLLLVGIAPALGVSRHLATRRLARPAPLTLAPPNANACLTNCRHLRACAAHSPRQCPADPDDARRACCPASHGRTCPAHAPVSR